MENRDYTKEMIRGSFKELMKTRGLRAISFANYDRWANNTKKQLVHTVNLNLENGYIRFYAYHTNPNIKTRGEQIADVPLSLYKETYKRAKEILKNEGKIPSKQRRNILVGLYR